MQSKYARLRLQSRPARLISVKQCLAVKNYSDLNWYLSWWICSCDHFI